MTVDDGSLLHLPGLLLNLLQHYSAEKMGMVHFRRTIQDALRHAHGVVPERFPLVFLVPHIGTLEKGKLADLLVLDRNPLDDIKNSESLSYVMLNGRLYDAKTLDEVAATPRKRLPFWFELPERGTR